MFETIKQCCERWPAIKRVYFLTRADVAYIAAEIAEIQQRQFLGSIPRVSPRGSVGEDLLDSALGEPQQFFSGRYLYRTVFDKAAALFRSLIANHPFLDGNKRMGLACTEIFLTANGYHLEATERREISGYHRHRIARRA